MHISSLELTNFKSFKSETSISNLSKNVNVIVGRNGSGKSNIITAFSKIFDPSRLALDDKQHMINDGNVLSDKSAIVLVEVSENDRFPFKEQTFSIRRVFDMRKDEYSVLFNKYKSAFEKDKISNILFENKDTMDNMENILKENKDNLNNNGNLMERDKDKLENNNNLINNSNINGKKKNENFKNELLLGKEEITGIFESVNLTNNSYFIIQQGKINYLATLDDKERLELIKEIAGASVYEKDRKESHDLLIESENNEERSGFILKNIEEKLGGLEKEKKMVVECEALEKEKRVIEVAILEIEKDEIDSKIKDYAIDSFIKSDDESDEFEISQEILKVENEISEISESAKKYYEHQKLNNTDIEKKLENIDKNNNQEKIEIGKKNLIASDIKSNIYNENNNNDIKNFQIDNKNDYNENQKLEVLDQNNNNFGKIKIDKELETINKNDVEISGNDENDSKESKKKHLNFNIELISLTEKLKKAKEKKSYVEKQLFNLKNKGKNLKKEEKMVKSDIRINQMEIENYKIYLNKRERIDINEEIKEIENLLIQKRKEYESFDENINKTILEEENIDPLKKLESLIEKRNKIWYEEKKFDLKRKSLLDDYIFLEKKMLGQGGFNLNSFNKIKHSKGVHGIVFELIAVTEDLNLALETVAGSSLFNIVVENEDVATDLIKKIEGRITFIPLNRMNRKNESKDIILDEAIPLSSQIKCNSIYKPILNYITKGSYLVSDVKTGVIISKTHNLNVVTLEGDFISKKGSISGGYTKKTGILDNLRNKTNEIKEIEKRKSEIKNELKKLEEDIEIVKSINENKKIVTGDKYYKESLKDIIVFLERKLKLLVKDNELKVKNYESYKNNGKKQMNILKNNEQNNEIKLSKLIMEIKTSENEMEDLERKNEDILKEINLIQKEIKIINEAIIYKSLNKKLNLLKKREEYLKSKENENELNFDSKKDFEKEKNNINKKILLEKKSNIMKKIGNLAIKKDEFNEYFDKKSNNTDILYKKLKEVNEKLKKYNGINKRANIQFKEHLEQKEKLFKRMEELKEGRKKIKEFINELDNKKNEAINLTLSMLQNNFKYFYEKLCPGNKAELIHKNNGIEIKINNKTYANLKNLSGGQKTLLALALIFSIQKIDPSPFYFFDEIDANLDKAARIRVCELIREISHCKNNNTQFFIATFREEMLEAGDKFFGVTFNGKNSSVSEIEKNEACEFLVDDKK